MAKRTPQGLTQAIKNAICPMQLSEMPDAELADVVRTHVRDYLSQKFSAAMLGHPECQEVLEELWTAITGEGRNDG